MAAGSQVKDSVFILEALQGLVTSAEEFPVKVEGTRTLPYAAVLVKLDPSSREIVIKLVRPLPPALAEGALFEMVFATQDKRFEGRITYLGREGYLQYRFNGPVSLLASDRRLWKRYPVRPREDFQVAAQDSDIPGHGLTGPLLNLSLGGLSFRVDRMLRLEDGMPMRPASHLFERGKTLSLLRVRGLPRGAVLEFRGQVVRVEEAHSEFHLGIQFSGLGEAERLRLATFLETRERQSSQGSSGYSQNTASIAWPSGAHAQAADGELLAVAGAALAESLEPAEPEPEPVVAVEEAGLEALARMDRRSTRILLVSPAGEDRDRIARHLEAVGYWRMDSVSDLFEAHAACKGAGAAPFRILVMDLEPSRTDGLESPGAIRHLEPLLRSFGELPVAFVTRVPDPLLEFMGRPGFAILAQAETEGPGWGELLDELP